MRLLEGDTLGRGAAFAEQPGDRQAPIHDPAAAKRLQEAAEELTPGDFAPDSAFRETLVKRSAALILPFSHRGVCVGALCVAGRDPGEMFSSGDRQLFGKAYLAFGRLRVASHLFILERLRPAAWRP